MHQMQNFVYNLGQVINFLFCFGEHDENPQLNKNDLLQVFFTKENTDKMVFSFQQLSLILLLVWSYFGSNSTDWRANWRANWYTTKELSENPTIWPEQKIISNLWKWSWVDRKSLDSHLIVCHCSSSFINRNPFEVWLSMRSTQRT